MRAPSKTARYHDTRDRDGCDDVFRIVDDAGRERTSIPFWDEPDTNEAAEAETKARRIVRDLNRNGPRHVRAFDDVA